MKTLFLECSMGAAGDMLMGALYELLNEADRKDFLDTMKLLFPNEISLSAQSCEKCGIYGTKMHVSIFGREEESAAAHTSPTPTVPEHNHSMPEHSHTASGHSRSIPEHNQSVPEHSHAAHQHTSYPRMLAWIDSLTLSPFVKEHAKAVYTLIGKAESKAHNTELSQIHFHEVGTLDALVDVVGCCVLLEQIAPEEIIASPIQVGSGTVSCAHGILPVPAPATAEILKDVPIYAGTIQGELCTPTGAALIKHFVHQFSAMPPMTVEKTGYGMGTRDYPAANCIRIFYGDMNILPVPSKRQLPHLQPELRPAVPAAEETLPDFYSERFHTLDQILELSCNLDDMTPEAISYALDMLMEADALDAYTTPVHMKKNRSGILLTCLCNPEQESTFSRLILTHTSTRGVRIQPCYRRTLEASFHKVSTPYGEITVKTSAGYGIEKLKPEYDEVAAAAKKHKVTFSEVYDAALLASRDLDT